MACVALPATAGAEPAPSSTTAADGSPTATQANARARARPKARAKKVKAQTRGQRQILRRKAIKVKVVARRPGKLKLTARSRTFDHRKLTRVAKRKRIRFKATAFERSGKRARKARKRTVRLKLTKRGRREIRSCQGRKIVVEAKGAGAHFELKRNKRRCAPRPIDLSRAADCDFIAFQPQSLCLMPFPDDYYTVKDKASPTRRRVELTDAAMPRNSSGQPIAAAPYNLNDGFSPGQAITLKVPGLDTPQALAATDPVGLADLGRYSDERAPVVVVDMTTGERWPIWVEIDSNASTPERTALLIHPAKNFAAGHRYAVAMRDLTDGAGKELGPPEGFRYYRDDLPSKERVVNQQRKRFEQVFRALRKAKIKRKDLYLAWDFTVASDENIAQRMLHIRDDAFRQLGDTNLADGVVHGGAPAFAIESVDTDPSPEVARRIRGTFTVPCYLTNGCQAPATFTLDANGNPIQQGAYRANFDCIVPHAAVDDPGAAPGRPSLYGHGLLGRASEVSSSPQRTLAQAHNFVFCATDEIGFSSGDIPNTIGILQNLGRFPELVDRSQQGLLDELLLGRLMINPTGFLSDPAFHVDPSVPASASPPVLDPSKLYYNGNSQGGILGGALTAVSPDFTRASLGVPAMNYSVLLNRSVDFDLYRTILDPAYPDDLTQPLALSLIQMLWDRADPNGYAHRMTVDPLPNTPPHEVLMNVAFGDHQVTNWQADVEARTIGAQAHAPVVYNGRWPGVEPLWDIPRIASYPYGGSAIVYWDSGPPRPDPGDPGEVIGTGPPPIPNVPNRSGADPHEDPRITPAEQQMVSEFLRPDAQSSISDTCGAGQACYSTP
ncbi:MAG: hypothetical protein GEU88_10135 [Solirubrobacterales bacterium]|nr:hypothetical protein [Solirubrobacterales bacterium]